MSVHHRPSDKGTATWRRTCAALVLTIPLAVLPATAMGQPAPGPSTDTKTYIVQFRDGVDPRAEAAAAKARGVGVGRVLTHVFPGMITQLNDAQRTALARNPRVVVIEEDQVVTADTTQTEATWGLDRIDQRKLPLSGSYSYDSSGVGVQAYVIDTGVRADHEEFGGRVAGGYDFVDDDTDASDCNGHGTHVAGTIGGATYGVAKEVTIVPVRVLDCAGSGTTSGVIAGLDWVKEVHVNGELAVGNMSLGGHKSKTLDTAVKSVIADGVTMAVAAGNSNQLACNFSPAGVPEALTVAASTSTDARASYSNYGSCVDLFAPGSSITSAWYTSTTATNTISGTSMATPHVAGVATRILEKNPGMTPAEVAATIKGTATKKVVESAGRGTPNRLLYIDPTS